MHIVIEHEKGGPWQLQVLTDTNEVNSEDFDPIKTIFFCEDMVEVELVVREIKKARLEK